ncbi:MAG: hypothetical protein LN569_04310 [Rickettsia endosymbiont of Labidopullus appendiculatus]|nr:hypothetical protein [Rickettsia endosymbiont of Labidopullus appendiculatus]
MKSHSFTSDDAKRSSDKNLQYIAECFDPNYDKHYNDKDKVQYRFDLDIQRNGIFYIETPNGGSVDLVAQCKLGKGDEYEVTYQDMYKTLTNNYKLSEQQTEYILAANYQAGIAGGMAGLMRVKSETYDDFWKIDETMNVWENEWIRDNVVSKIIIDQNNNVSFVGGRKVMFDCRKQVFSSTPDLKEMLGTKFNSQDFAVVNITATLGAVGEPNPTQQVIIDVAGTGEVASKFIGKLKTVETKCPAKEPASIIESNNVFSKQLLTDPLSNEEYKKVVTEKVSKIIFSDEDQTKAITVLKKLDGVKEALADLLVEQIDQSIALQKDKKTDKLSAESINNIAKKTVEQLSKFIDQPDKYAMKKFTKQLVEDRATSSDATVPRKNFIEKICEYLKDKWHGYSAEKSKPPLEQLHDKAKIIGQEAKSHMSSKMAISQPPNNKKEGVRTI